MASLTAMFLDVLMTINYLTFRGKLDGERRQRGMCEWGEGVRGTGNEEMK